METDHMQRPRGREKAWHAWGAAADRGAGGGKEAEKSVGQGGRSCSTQARELQHQSWVQWRAEATAESRRIPAVTGPGKEDTRAWEFRVAGQLEC